MNDEIFESPVSDTVLAAPIKRTLEKVIAANPDSKHPTTVKFLRELDDTTKEPNRKRYEIEIYPRTQSVTRSGIDVTVDQGILQQYAPKTKAFLLSGHVLADDATIAELKDLQSQIDSINSEFAKFTPAMAHKTFSDQASNLSKKIEGKESLENVVINAREHFQETFRIQRQALVLKMQPFLDRGRELSGPIIKAAMAVIREQMAAIEETERELSISCGLNWLPSALFCACAAILLHDRGTRVNETIPPRSILAGLIDL